MRFKKFLEELAFQTGKDKDYPAGLENGVIIFDPHERYEIKGKTHGIESHAIKHLIEFDPKYYDTIINIIKTLVLSKGTGYILSGTDIKRISSNVSNAQIVNLLDRINDKMFWKERLTSEEVDISKYIKKIASRYEEIVNENIQHPINITPEMTKEQIEFFLNKGKNIKYIVNDRNADLTHYYNPTHNCVVIQYQGEVRSMFTLKGIGWYANPSRKFYNQALREIMIKK